MYSYNYLQGSLKKHLTNYHFNLLIETDWLLNWKPIMTVNIGLSYWYGDHQPVQAPESTDNTIYQYMYHLPVFVPVFSAGSSNQY